MFSSLFHVALYQPLLNLFVVLYNIMPGHDLGAVIIVITVLLRGAVYPLTASSIASQRSMQEMQPKLDAIRKQYAGDTVKQNQAIMALYQEHKINPLTSCLPLLIQLPILIALFWVLRDGLASKNIAENLYTFVHNPGTLNSISFGFLNLETPSIVLAFLAGGAQFLQAWMVARQQPPKQKSPGATDENMTAMMNKQMMIMMPALTIFMGFKFPAGLTLYWFFSTALMALQQWYMFRGMPHPKSEAVTGEVVKK